MAGEGPRAPAPGEKPGLIASLRQLGRTLLETLESRVELLALELDRERVRVTRLLVLGVAALFFLSLGALTLTLFVIVLFWDSHRLVAIGVLTALYLGAGVGIVFFAKSEAARAKRPFSATIEQLKKDRERFARH